MQSNVEESIQLTPTRGKGRPKGTSKKKSFKGTPKKSNNDIQATSNECLVRKDAPVGLINKSNVCFFNSLIQVMHSLTDFREFVNNYVININDSEENTALVNMIALFNEIEKSMKTDRHCIGTHDCVLSLNLRAYTENLQYDAEECLTQIINLFYPQIDDHVPDNCLFRLDGGESVLCFNCNKSSSTTFRSAVCSVSIPAVNLQTSVSSLVENQTSDAYGQIMDEKYKCDSCPTRTQASQNRTLWNVEKYLIIQVKIFNYDKKKKVSMKTTPNLIIEEEFQNILLGKFDLKGVVYHIGDSMARGHYVSSVKINNVWYTLNDEIISMGVKLMCSSNDIDGAVPYLLVYEKNP